jgi:hypothetical protein
MCANLQNAAIFASIYAVNLTARPAREAWGGIVPAIDTDSVTQEPKHILNRAICSKMYLL